MEFQDMIKTQEYLKSMKEIEPIIWITYRMGHWKGFPAITTLMIYDASIAIDWMAHNRGELHHAVRNYAITLIEISSCYLYFLVIQKCLYMLQKYLNRLLTDEKRSAPSKSGKFFLVT